MTTTPSKIKKVSAYPISVIVRTPAANTNAQIVRLTLQGCLVEYPPSNLQPGDKFDITFQVPVLNTWINEPVRLIKLYSQWSGGGAPAASKAVDPAAANATKADPAGGALTFGSPTAEGRSVVHLIEIHFQHLGEEARIAIAQFIRTIKQS